MTMIKMEWIKLLKKKNTKVLIGLYGVILLVMSGLYIFGEKSFGLSIYTESQFIKATLSTMMGFILPFIALYLSSTKIIGEFSHHTIKNLMLLPIEKSKIFFGKIVSVQGLLGVLLLMQFTVSLILGLLLDGGFSLGVLMSLFGEYLGAFVILGLINLSGSLLAMVFNSGGLTIFIGYVLYIGMNFISLYVAPFRTISLTTVISNYGSLFNGTSLTLLLSVLAYYMILYIVGSQLFEKKEVQSCQSE
ncbi:MAG: ABC transporter permease [Clostridiales bacterium]|nr:ABC transporter permease [Clostridiales bacterium]